MHYDFDVLRSECSLPVATCALDVLKRVLDMTLYGGLSRSFGIYLNAAILKTRRGMLALVCWNGRQAGMTIESFRSFHIPRPLSEFDTTFNYIEA